MQRLSTETQSRSRSQQTNEQPHVDETEADDAGEVTKCPECSGRLRTDESDAEKFCVDCGLVIESDSIDHGPEWRAYNTQEWEEKARTGSPESMSIHDKGLSTVIDWKDKDARGNTLNARQKRKMKRLRRWDEHSRAKDSKERNLKKALGEINRMSSALGIPDNVKEMAAVIYRRAVEKDLLVGRSIEGVATASLHCACRQAGVPRTMTAISKVSRVQKKPISSAYRYLSNELELEVNPPDPVNFMPSVASDAGVSEQVRIEAENIVKAYIDAGEHSGRHPRGVAAAALYTANKLLGDPDNLTQQQVAEAGQVCVVTIRSRHNELLEYEEAVETDLDALDETTDTTDQSTEQTTDEATSNEPTESSSDNSSDVTRTETDTSIDSIEITLVSPDECVVHAPEDATQNEVMIRVIEFLITDHDLFDHIEPPHAAPDCSNYFVVNDSEEEAPDQKASWTELSTGHELNTKLGKGQKTRHTKHLAAECGLSLTFGDGW